MEPMDERESQAYRLGYLTGYINDVARIAYEHDPRCTTARSPTETHARIVDRYGNELAHARADGDPCFETERTSLCSLAVEVMLAAREAIDKSTARVDALYREVSRARR